MEEEKGLKDEALESRPTEMNGAPFEPIPRNKRPARCYFMTMAVVYLVLLITAVVALAHFGLREAEINRVNSQDKLRLGVIHPSQTCILFAKHADADDPDFDLPNDFILDLHSSALCGYVLWGLISVTIVAFVWLVYSIVLAAIGSKM